MLKIAPRKVIGSQNRRTAYLCAIMCVMGRLGGRVWAGGLSPGVRGERGGTRRVEAELVPPAPPPPHGDLGLATGLAP